MKEKEEKVETKVEVPELHIEEISKSDISLSLSKEENEFLNVTVEPETVTKVEIEENHSESLV